MTTEEKIKEPLKWPWAVTKLICSQCGSVSEIDITTAYKMISVMDILKSRPEIKLETAEDFSKYYFESNYCKNCESKEVSLKEIES